MIDLNKMEERYEDTKNSKDLLRSSEKYKSYHLYRPNLYSILNPTPL